jgi:hypothetical protein
MKHWELPDRTRQFLPIKMAAASRKVVKSLR